MIFLPELLFRQLKVSWFQTPSKPFPGCPQSLVTPLCHLWKLTNWCCEAQLVQRKERTRFHPFPTPILQLLSLSNIYLKMFISQPSIRRLFLGLINVYFATICVKHPVGLVFIEMFLKPFTRKAFAFWKTGKITLVN